MSKIDQLVKTIVKAIDEKDRKKTSALDTVATVSRIDGDTAWVKFAGSDSETPVKQTIAVKKGDKVQVRASKGSAWITGNITSPPTDNTLAEEAVKKSDTATKRAKRAEDMSIVADVMYYLASDQDEGVTTEDEGWTQEPQEATVALPYLWCYHEYTRGNGTKFNSDPVIISRYTEGGAGVNSITTYYALGTSTSTAPTSGWATTFSFRSGYYIWRKELISLTDGTTTWSAPVYDGGLTEACELAFDAAQYIWTQPAASATTNVPSGQYVTEVDKDSYRTSPSGNALLLRSAGIYLRNGINTVASFLDAGVRLFDQTGSELAEFLTSGMRIYSPDYQSKPIVDIYADGGILGTLSLNRLDANRQIDITPESIYMGSSSSTNAQIYWTTSGNITIDSANTTSVSSALSVTGNTHTYGNLSTSGNLSVQYGKITAKAINNDLFAVSSESVSTSSGTGNLTGTATATKTGYYPLAIAGLSVATGGCYSRGAYLTSQASGSCTVNFRAYNSGSSQAVSATAYVLWVNITA